MKRWFSAFLFVLVSQLMIFPAAHAAIHYPPMASYFPSIARQNIPFEVKINYGQVIDCGIPFIQVGTGLPHAASGTLTWVGWDGLNATFNYTVPVRRNYTLYSHIFTGTPLDCLDS